ncbi:MAG: hypothetical protein ACQEVA_09415 [Myxococcota bacterium]
MTVLLILCLWPTPALAQDASTEGGFEEEFRSWVVEETEWRPRRGVALTTTRFAREHAEKYAKAAELGSFWADVSHHVASTKGVVLFQTDEFDIYVVGDSHSSVQLCVLDRGRPGCEVWGLVGPARARDPRATFIDATGDGVLELKVELGGACGAGCYVEALTIYSLDGSQVKKLYHRGWEHDYQPGSTAIEKKGLRSVSLPSEPGGPLVFEYEALLVLGAHAVPDDDAARPRFRETCRLAEKGAKFQCEDHLKERGRIDRIEPFLDSNEWETNASRIRFLIENLAALRAHGFVVEAEFVRRLERHLPESMRR